MENKLKLKFEENGIKNIPDKIIGSRIFIMGLGECKLLSYNKYAYKYPITVETLDKKINKVHFSSIIFLT